MKTYNGSIVYLDIEKELENQEFLKLQGKFEKSSFDSAKTHNKQLMITILAEELGEIARAFNDNESIECVREELVQLASCCVGMICGLDYSEVELQNKAYS